MNNPCVELDSARKWVNSLTRNELIRAMEFNFSDDDNNGDNSSSSSHEYNLLEQMIQQQSPPPVPIHPRALSFRPATQMGATDGKNEIQRIRQNRFRKPKLFQFLERESVGCSNRWKHKKTRKKMAGATAVVVHTRYDVIARQFVTASGDVLSVGCTHDQKEADNTILECTGIKYGSAYNNTKSCKFLWNERQPSSDNNSSDESTRVDDAKCIRRILHIASRGKFLSISYSASSSSFFLAPWLNPCSQWFSLPMYLASRYEVAIWNSYHRRNSINNVPYRTLLEDASYKLSTDRIKNAILKSLNQALATDFIPKDPTTLIRNIRDSILWSIFNFNSDDTNNLHQRILSLSSLSSQNSIMLSVTTIPLLDLGSTKDTFRLSVQSHLLDILIQELQNDLLLDSRSNGDCSGASNKGPSTRKKKSKKRRRKRQQKAQLPVLREETRQQEDEIVHEVEEDSDDDESLVENHYLATISAASNNSSSRKAEPSQDDLSRNKVIILKVLEEIVDAVNDRVGDTHNTASGEENSEWNVVGRQREIKDSNRVKEIESPPVSLSPGLAESKVQEELEPAPPNDERPLQGTPSPQSEHYVHSFLDSNNIESPDPYDLPYREHNPVLGISSGLTFNFNENTYDEWGRMRRYQNRDKSLLAELFLRKEKSEESQDELLMVSSTAASIASSSGIESGIDDEGSDEVGEGIDNADSDEIEEDEDLPSDQFIPVDDLVDGIVPAVDISTTKEPASGKDDGKVEVVREALLDSSHDACPSPASAATELTSLKASVADSSPVNQKEITPPCSPEQTPFPPEPATPPPQLSPILVSLGDLRRLRTAGSLPGSPVLPNSNRLVPSWSREDLRVAALTDDQQFRSRRARSVNLHVESLSSKGNTVFKFKKETKKANLNHPFVPDLGHTGRVPTGSEGSKVVHKESCAFSETAADGHREGQQWVEPTKFNDEPVDVTPRDGSTTMSGLSPQENEEVSTLREERNSFRDMCLTLGAEVSMLKNLLAAEKSSKHQPTVDHSHHQQEYGQPLYGPSPYTPEFIPSHFHGIPRGITSSRTIGAMSDAGIHRVDQDSTTVSISEDGTDIVGPHEGSNHRKGHIRRLSSNATAHSVHDYGSDASLEHSGNAAPGSIDYRNLNRDTIGSSVPSHGLHSRLTKDVLSFVNSMNIQLRKQSARRKLATERLSRLLTALWPRAQVKMYGSHVSGCCLPSSDLDFVVCLPAVHKNNPAVTPGDLQGRNDTNETSQNKLARKLKGESWIDTTSIKLIDRTTVPVIKLSTKDTRAHALQLDISFDSPEHHGLDAVELVKRIMQELPMIRPLILVIKRFLLDRGLLTAYTGGLSSYCLFLMIARYLQEHGSSWGDCGSLLMGFLDFYGNCFDPRSTGISVRRRQYFPRSHDAAAAGPLHYPQEQQVWGMKNHHLVPSTDLIRRHSHNSEKSITAAVPAVGGNPHGIRPSPRFQPISSSSPRRFVPQFNQGHHGPYNNVSKPYTFDPLFVEDPLSAGNNVGRNAFRIFQVQRAFSDAHRALVASLEWDMYSAAELNDGVGDYPLLKCLLQSEDVFYELDDNR